MAFAVRLLVPVLGCVLVGACGSGGGGGRTPATVSTTVQVTASPSTTAAASWSMPKVVGKGLQEAQDAIQAITGFGIVFTSSHDATGAGRKQLVDRNWKVCTQNVPPGATITRDTRIDFGAVKLDEPC